MNVDLTDPARDLAELLDRIKESPINGSLKGYTALSQFMGVEQNSLEFITLTGAIATRFSILSSLSDGLSDSEMRVSTRQALREALSRLGGLTHPGVMGATWNDIKKSRLGAADIALLDSASPIVRVYRPYVKICAEDRAKILIQLEAFEDEEGEYGLDKWLDYIIRESVSRLRTVLTYFEFFGHDRAIEELVTIANRLRPYVSESKSDSRGTSRTLKFLNVVALTITLFVGPPQVVEAVEWYGEAVSKRLAWVRDSVPSEMQASQKLLEDLSASVNQSATGPQ